MAIKVLTKNMDVENLQQIDVYESLGGYKNLSKALKEYDPDSVVDIIKKSGLRRPGRANRIS